LKKLHQDLERIGLRQRRQHDARRTFISLARGGGARKDMLKWVTHGPGDDVMDDYTTPPWEALCEAVACLRVGLKTGDVTPIRKAAISGEVYGESTTSPATDAPRQMKRAASAGACGSSEWRGVRDSNPWPPA